jgi:DNA recombination protein RmuC
MEITTLLLGVFIGLVLGSLAILLWKAGEKNRLKQQIAKTETRMEMELEQQKEMLEENELLEQRLQVANEKDIQQREEKAKMLAEMEYLRKKMQENKEEFTQLREKMNNDFELLASKIMKANTEEFSIINRKRVDEILSPLKEKITTFEKKVDDTYQKGLKDQTDLRAELKKLYELNNKISEEAKNLTKALKGDSKTQGDWGEVILERILERSGLIKDSEYKIQMNVKNEVGQNLRPDVVVFLPDNKHIVIDSKVSLTAYENYINADDEMLKSKYIKEHTDSIKRHIKELSEKQYHLQEELYTPEFVLLFIPIESSFSLAIQHEQNLFNLAWDNKIVIVSPSTLFATLKTIESIWKQEKQTRNAQEIAREAGGLHDKFYGFVSDLEAIGKGIDSSKNKYDDAMKKLSTGKANILSRVDKLKVLGAKADKSLADKL